MQKKELPEKLKRLYNHWGRHAGWQATAVTAPSFDDPSLLKELTWFVNERMKMWEQKNNGSAAPYSKNSILAQYRFCNVYRELDRQTIEFHTMLNTLRGDFPLWLLNMFYCRVVARPETIRYTGLLSFNKKANRQVYEKLLGAPYPRYGTPYVFPISVIQRGKFPTRELFLTQYLPAIIHDITNEITSWKHKNVYDAVQRVVEIFGYSLKFHWTEVLIDAAYQYPEHFNLFGRFPVGPGSLPTIQRIAAHNDPSYIVERLTAIPLHTGLTYEDRPVVLSAENWEGVCCEFRKYTNLSTGSGRRRKYSPQI